MKTNNLSPKSVKEAVVRKAYNAAFQNSVVVLGKDVEWCVGRELEWRVGRAVIWPAYDAMRLAFNQPNQNHTSI